MALCNDLMKGAGKRLRLVIVVSLAAIATSQTTTIRESLLPAPFMGSCTEPFQPPFQLLLLANQRSQPILLPRKYRVRHERFRAICRNSLLKRKPRC